MWRGLRRHIALGTRRGGFGGVVVTSVIMVVVGPDVAVVRILGSGFAFHACFGGDRGGHRGHMGPGGGAADRGIVSNVAAGLAERACQRGLSVVAGDEFASVGQSDVLDGMAFELPCVVQSDKKRLDHSGKYWNED